jgi:hypothetical protein
VARDRTLACVFAHPEGEQGDIRLGFPATRETLGAVRRAEDEAAWQALGRPPDRHAWLGLTDGGVADVPVDQVVDAVAAVLDEEDPAGFRRLLHGAVPQSVFERWNRQRAELGLFTFDPTQI